MVYYADNGYMVQVNLVKSLFPLAEAPPIPLNLAKLAPCGHRPDLGKFEGPTFTKPRVRRRNRERVKQAKSYEASLHQDHEDWPDDESLSKTSTMHKAKGLYALDSLNSNAWSIAVAYSQSTSADFLVFRRRGSGLLLEKKLSTHSGRTTNGRRPSVHASLGPRADRRRE